MCLVAGEDLVSELERAGLASTVENGPPAKRPPYLLVTLCLALRVHADDLDPKVVSIVDQAQLQGALSYR